MSDTSSETAAFFGALPAALVTAGTIVTPGTPISMALAGGLDVTFVAGEGVNQNLVAVIDSKSAILSSLQANTGIEFFFRFAVLYHSHSADGQLGFKPLN